MGIGVQGEASGEVTQHAGHCLDVHSVLEGNGSEGVPLRYNYDKPEKPRISRVFGYQARFFILFQPEKSSREHRLKEIERGEIVPDSFMDGITAMLGELMQTYKPIPGAEVLFPSGREVVGKCPRCKADVTETPKGFFCENRACSFTLWKNSKFFTAKKKTLTKTLAATLLKDGRAPLKGCYSEKTGKTYDTVILLEDDGQRVSYKMVFGNG